MGSFNWLHFSDLHLVPKVNFKTQWAKDRLIDFLRDETEAGRLPCDYIFFTGDIANMGKYDGVTDFLHKLFDSLGWSNYDRVFWSVGNHDISSRESLLRSLAIKEIRTQKNDSVLFEKYMGDPRTRDELISICLDGYNRCYKKVFNKKAPGPNAKTPHMPYPLPDLNLVVLNTCITSCDDEDEHKLYIQERGLIDVFKNLNRSKPTFVIGHHGIGYFRESEQDILRDLFDSNNVDAYFCGHSHKLGYIKIPGDKRDIHQITCGGVTVGDVFKCSFIHGHYDNENHDVLIKPYSYTENKWHYDPNLDYKLNGENRIPLTSTLIEPALQKIPVDSVPVVSENSNSIQKKQWERSAGFFRTPLFVDKTKQE